MLEIITDNITRVRSTNGRDQSASRRTGQLLDLRIPVAWPNDGQLDWCLRDGDNIQAHGRAQDLEEIPADVRQAPLRVWTPAATTLLTTADLPTRSQRKINQALPFALEDKLLGDPSELFFAHTFNDDKKLAVAATARKQLQQWLAALAAADLYPLMLAPLTLSIPLMDKCWNITFWDDEAWVRTGTYSGFSCPAQIDAPPHILITALAAARASQQAPESLLVCNPPEGFNATEWANTLALELPVDDVHPWENISAASPINLLQREFSPRSEKHGIAHRLLPAIVMSGMLLVGTMAVNGWQWWHLSNGYQTARTEMNSILRASFPEQSHVIVDPYRQMRRNLEQLGKRNAGDPGNSYLNLLAKAATVLGHQTGASLLAMEYRDNSLTIDMQLTDYRTMDTLKKALQTSDLAIEVKNASTNKEGVSARIRLHSQNSGVQR